VYSYYAPLWAAKRHRGDFVKPDADLSGYKLVLVPEPVPRRR
jgi:hypothetical protein